MKGTILISAVFLVLFVAKPGALTDADASQGPSNSSNNAQSQTDSQGPSNSSNNGIVNQGGSGDNKDTTVSLTTTITTETKDPLVKIDEIVSQITKSCNSGVADKNCDSIVAEIRSAKNITEKCSSTQSLKKCIDEKCAKATDAVQNVNEMEKICNGANLISLSTMLICSLAAVFWFTQG